jgi:hypothetical protein
LLQFNCNEAVNFATADWLEFGMQAEEIYRDYRTVRPSVFSHARLIFTLCHNLEDIPKEYLQQYVFLCGIELAGNVCVLS